jgi:hypothetical protein
MSLPRHAACDHVRHGVRRALQQSADAHDCRADEDCVLTAHVVAEDERGDCAEKAANVVDRGYCALHAHVVAYAECVEEVACDDNAAEDTLVVAELWSFSSAIGDTFLRTWEETSTYQSHISRASDRHPKGQPSSSKAEIPFALHRVSVVVGSICQSVSQSTNQSIKVVKNRHEHPNLQRSTRPLLIKTASATHAPTNPCASARLAIAVPDHITKLAHERSTCPRSATKP